MIKSNSMDFEEKKFRKFSIVVLNWNSLAYLQKCLESLKHQSFSDFELICVDNGSTDGSKEWLDANDLSDIVRAPSQTILCDENLGFAEGMNVGMRKAVGKFVIPLNVDMILSEDFLEKAVELFTKNPEISMLGAKIFLYDDKPTDEIICTGVWLSKHFSLYTILTDSEKEREVFGPAGCCPIFTKKALIDSQLDSEIAGTEHEQYYDGLYFAYGEDVDLFLRMNLFGHRCLYSPKLFAWHAHSGTQKGVRWHTKDKATIKRLAANVFFTWLKNCPLGLLLKRMPLVIFTPGLMSLSLILKAPNKCLVPLLSYFSIIKNFKRTLKIRQYLIKRIDGIVD